MRDNPNYRAQNGRSQVAVSAVVCLTTAGRKTGGGHGLPSPALGGAPIPLRDHARRRAGDRRDEWMGIHCNGMHAYKKECTALHWIGMVSNPVESMGCHWVPVHGLVLSRANAKGRRRFSLQSGVKLQITRR